jgi:hypothetical protein
VAGSSAGRAQHVGLFLGDQSRGADRSECWHQSVAV